MRITIQSYAKALIYGLKTNRESKKIAKNFWFSLQKNRQYKDLPKILEALDQEYAKSKNILLAKIYSPTPLTPTQIREIKMKLERKLSKSIAVTCITNPNLTAGFIVKIDDREIDLSLDRKIKKLKKKLMSK